MVYCHEFLSDRWSYRPYIDHLRDLGFDVFTFDFRNHGESQAEPGYSRCTGRPTARSATSARRWPTCGRGPTATRPATGSSGSAGAGRRRSWSRAAERDVWGVITDGAFPTIGTMMAYILRWAELYLRNPLVRGIGPAMALPQPGPVGPEAVGAAAGLPLPRRGAGRRAAGAPALAGDPRPARHLHQPRSRRRSSSSRQRAAGDVAGPGRQAQPLPRARARGLRRPPARLRRPIRPAPADHRARRRPSGPRWPPRRWPRRRCRRRRSASCPTSTWTRSSRPAMRARSPRRCPSLSSGGSDRSGSRRSFTPPGPTLAERARCIPGARGAPAPFRSKGMGGRRG